MWNTQEITESAMKRDQEIASYQAEGENNNKAINKFKSAFVKEPCVLTCVPMHMHVVLLLHILLDLGNTFMNEFLIIVQKRVEKLSDDDVQAQDITIIFYLGHENVSKEFNKCAT